MEVLELGINSFEGTLPAAWGGRMAGLRKIGLE